MRKYTAEKYIKLVENIDDEILQSHMHAEIEVISKVRDSKNKTFIDLGAGHGRVLPNLVKIARNVISIELNPDMLLELKKRTKNYKNAIVIDGDIQKLSDLLRDADIKNPVLLLLQNTLGTIEGNYKNVLSEMKSIAKKYQGEVIISLFRKESLKDWGLKLYPKVKEITGESDFQKIDFNKGIFVTKSGNISKWWSPDEIRQIKEFFGGKIVNEVLTPQFCVIHAKILS